MGDSMKDPEGKDMKAAKKTAVEEFVSRLSDEHKMLIILKSQLYGGSWEPMIDDLTNRLDGKPYIFKLANRIQDDIERIEEMRQFEKQYQIDLSDYVQIP